MWNQRTVLSYLCGSSFYMLVYWISVWEKSESYEYTLQWVAPSPHLYCQWWRQLWHFRRVQLCIWSTIGTMRGDTTTDTLLGLLSFHECIQQWDSLLSQQLTPPTTWLSRVTGVMCLPSAVRTYHYSLVSSICCFSYCRRQKLWPQRPGNESSCHVYGGLWLE